MMTEEKSLHEQIVDAYQKGTSIRNIEKELNVGRSTIYYALQKAGASPSRAKQTRRLRGDLHDLATLVLALEASDARVQELEARVAELEARLAER